MLAQTLKIVSYLIIALIAGIITTLITDSIENVTVEKRIRQNIETDIKNAVVSFKDSAPLATSADEFAFVKKYVSTVMEDKVAARERGMGKLTDAADETLFLFTLHENNRSLDFYIQKSYLKSELAILDVTDYISGIMTTILVFTSIVVYTEYRKRAHMLQQQFEVKHEELRMALEQQEALALLGRMSATLAHELKTPVSTISNLIHVLPSRLSDELFTKRFVTIVREELDRTQQLIDNLLVYGKDIELRKQEWIAVQSLLLPLADRFQMAMTADMPSGLEIFGDGFYLDLMFQNIFRNSREAGADQVSVTALISQAAPELFGQISCEDNGAGYPKTADLNELTSPFVTSRSRGGGLGLYLAKKIASAHEGTLTLYRKDGGAGIKIILPERRMRINE